MKLNFKKTLLVVFVVTGLFLTKDVKGQSMSFTEALSKAVPGKLIQVVISSNQDNGVVTYITGTLSELKDKQLSCPGSSAPWIYKGAEPLSLYSSDRTVAINTGPNRSVLTNPVFQPFRYDKFDPIGFTIEKDAKGQVIGTFTILNASNTKFTINLQPAENLLYGIGQPILGTVSKKAIYIIAFTGVTNDVQKSK